MFRKAAWGIDIGRTALKAVRLAHSGGGVALTEYEFVRLPCGPDVGDDERDIAIRQALTEFLSKHNIGFEPVGISVPGQMMLNRFLSLPPVQEKRIPEIVRYEARQLIPFPLEEIVWDFQLIEPEPGIEEREGALFAVKEEVVRGILREPVAVDMPVDFMQVAPLAVYNLVKFDRSPTEPVAILDMGASTTDLVILDGKHFWLRNLPTAGSDITEAFREKFGMGFEEAEELKRTSGESRQADKIFGVVKPVLRDLVGEVDRSMGFYKSQAGGVKFGKIILMGNGASQAGLRDFLAENLEYDVEEFSMLERVQMTPGLDAGTFLANIKSFAVSLGLALQGLDQTAIKTNLLPHDIAVRRKMVRKKPLVVVAVALLAIGVGLAYFFANRELSKTEAVLNDNDTFVRYAEGVRARYLKAKEECGPWVEDTEKLRRIGMRRVEWNELLETVTGCALPKRVWLTSLMSEMRSLSDEEGEEEREERSGGPGGPGGPAYGPGGDGGGSRAVTVQSADWSKGREILHFTLEGQTEEVDAGARYIMDNIVEPLEKTPRFSDVKLVTTAREEMTLEVVRPSTEGAAEEGGPEAVVAGREVVEEKRAVLRFRVEWDYIRTGYEEQEEPFGKEAESEGEEKKE